MHGETHQDVGLVKLPLLAQPDRGEDRPVRICQQHLAHKLRALHKHKGPRASKALVNRSILLHRHSAWSPSHLQCNRTWMELRLLQRGVTIGQTCLQPQKTGASAIYEKTCPGPDLVSSCSSSLAQLEESPCEPFRPAACRELRDDG